MKKLIPLFALLYAGLAFSQDPAIYFDFAGDSSLTDKVAGVNLTFTRASARRCVDGAGVLQTLTDNVPCFGHDPSTLANIGIVIEGARTNLFLQSNNFTTTWVPNANLVVTAASGTSPDGTSNAVLWADTAAGGTGAVQATHNYTSTVSTVYTMSAWAKDVQAGFVQLRLANLGALDVFRSFNIASCTVGTYTGATASVSRATQYANGWCRLETTFTSDAADTSGTIIIRVSDNDGFTAPNLDGTTTARIYGAQLEVGGWASSYIPTNGSTATRAADALSTTDVSDIVQGTGTVYARSQGFFPALLANNHRIWQMESDGSHRFFVYLSTAANISALVDNAGTTFTAGIASIYAPRVDFRSVFGYVLNNSVLNVNGTPTATDTGVTIPNVSSIILGNGTAMVHYGAIAEWAYFTSRKNDATIDGYADGTIPVYTAPTPPGGGDGLGFIMPLVQDVQVDMPLALH